MTDNDGEFLLIEAADTIPKWLDPETAENRVGLVFLITFIFKKFVTFQFSFSIELSWYILYKICQLILTN